MRMTVPHSALLALLLSLCLVSTHAFVSFEAHRPLSVAKGARALDPTHPPSPPRTLAWSSLQESPESLKQEIEVMRLEAQRRLEKLNQQMEEFKHEHEQHKHDALMQKFETEATQSQMDLFDEKIALAFAEPQGKSSSSSSPASSSSTALSAAPTGRRLDDTLLDDTRWKIVFNIGREPGTWMPKSWGASGDRLLFEVVVDFTSEPMYERDDFFQGIAGCKTLEVVDAFVFPRGVGATSTGRKPIKVFPTGGFKILQGQGPLGTDIVRFCIDLDQDVKANEESDVVCPAGRIYATCGYFPMSEKKSTAYKDRLAEEHNAISRQYQELQAEMDMDDRWFSLDHLQRMKEMYAVRKQLESVSKQLQQARQREPERSQLRMSRKGDVGLSREGGVCCKVHKGLAVEYHILGRMELASVEQRDDHDEYEELVHQLHP